MSSIYWYDLETSGASPRWDRILQFAGLRTNLDLDPIGDEHSTYVRLPDDVIPDPDAVLITGITPQLAQREGVSEWSALRRINQLFSEPGTCAAGYNSLRFDDEFIRFGLYRNLMDPYAREWRNGNSRWDIIDLARAAAALRPQGVNWPKDRNGLPVYTLEAVAAANGLEHGQAHDALSDVRATLALARLLRKSQPKLFGYFFAARLKARLRQLLEPYGAALCVHISGKYPRRRHCFAPVASICAHPTNANSVIVADVGEDIEPLLDWSEERLREALFSTEAEQRPALKEIRLNRCPFLAPLSVIRPEDAARLQFDAEAGERRRRLLSRSGLGEKISRIYETDAPAQTADVEAALYDGFINDEDRGRCAKLQGALARHQWLDLTYRDARLTQLAARLKARNFPQHLTAGERMDWSAWVCAKITAADVPWRTLAKAEARLRELQATVEGKEDREGKKDGEGNGGGGDSDVLGCMSAHIRRLQREHLC